jgi:predicted molibdopterin-dependent oxidoreductase YjgC
LAKLIHFADAAAIRSEIARAVPAYEGIQNLRQAGDQVQWGGPRLCERPGPGGKSIPDFGTQDGRARFSAMRVSEFGEARIDGKFKLSTRRGKQFNSMVHRAIDPLGSARDDVLMNESDAKRLGLLDGDAVTLTSSIGSLKGRCRIAPICAGNVQVHWPEGNVLIERGVSDPECGIPDYNTVVDIEAIRE